MLKIYILLTLILGVDNKIVRRDEICGEFDGRRMYLELGEYGIVESNQIKNNSLIKKSMKTITHNRQCSLELITCPSCIIKVTFTYLNISRNCGKNSLVDSCGCDYVWIYEPPFEEVSGEQFCGHFIQTNTSFLIYKSQTRSIAINFLYSNSHDYAFTLEYVSERNRYILDGYPKYSNMNNGTQFISSPFFPYIYPRDLSMEYVINCKTSEACKVRLIFTDFQISSSSLIEFFDWNGQRMHVATGSIFRPPILISTGPSLVIRFYANGGSNLGFKANYMFLLGEKDKYSLKPNTDCGGFVNNLGGAITMMNMIKDGTKSYDCFWILHPPASYLHLKTQLYLKLITFSDFAGSTELIVRQGLTSNEPVVEILRHPISQYVIAKQKEHVVPLNQGFYVSLKGIFRPESRLAIIYSAFNYKDCYSRADFLCRNLRCIPSYLICDGFDHCGDNSDETTNCLQEPKERSRWSHTPNFYFPKIDRYQYLKTATIVFVVCSLGLMTLIFVLIVILYRINARHRNQRQLQTHLQTINDMLEEGSQSVTIEEIIIPDEPPGYEAPPNYDEINKFKAEERRKTRLNKKKLLNMPCSHCNNPDTESTNNEENNLINELASTSRSCQTTPLPIPQTILIPKTPPPKYTPFQKATKSESDIKIVICDFDSEIINTDLIEEISPTLEVASNKEIIINKKASGISLGITRIQNELQQQVLGNVPTHKTNNSVIIKREFIFNESQNRATKERIEFFKKAAEIGHASMQPKQSVIFVAPPKNNLRRFIKDFDDIKNVMNHNNEENDSLHIRSASLPLGNNNYIKILRRTQSVNKIYKEFANAPLKQYFSYSDSELNIKHDVNNGRVQVKNARLRRSVTIENLLRI